MSKKKYHLIAILDTIEDRPISQSFELIAFADSFAYGDLSGTLLVVPGKSAVKLCEFISEKYGIDTAAMEHDEFYYPNPELLSRALYGIIDEHKPEMVIFTHTMRNCQIAAGLSVSMKASSATGVESFEFEHEGYVFRRSIFNGKLKENVRLKTAVKIVTVLPGAYTLAEDRIPYNKNPSVIQIKLNEASARFDRISASPQDMVNQYDVKRYIPLSVTSESEGDVKLEEADVIISVGRGIGKQENLELIRKTASIFSNSAIGASRPICDQKWLPFNQQVGITGRTVSPKLYLACGISGSQQHIAGMKNSQCIVAINTDPNTAIFSISDYIIIEDILSFLPVLVRLYKERKSKPD